MVLTLLICAIVGLQLWSRLAPSDPSRWHVPIDATDDHDQTGGALRLLPGQAKHLDALDRIIMATPRTVRLAGTVSEGRVTYITRSAVWGVPDYTTIEARSDGSLALWGRLRFGRSDLGVNRKRLQGWIANLPKALPQG